MNLPRFSLTPEQAEGARSTVKAWLMPILVSVLFAAVVSLGTIVWKTQQDALSSADVRIQSLQTDLNATKNTLAVITDTQRQSGEDRKDFQTDMTRRMEKMQDVLTALGENLSALTALQRQRDGR